MPDLPDFLQTDNHVLWALIGVGIAMVFTLEAVQTAVEGAWPHQRRPSTMLPRERSAHTIWGVVALAIIAGGLLLLANLGVLAWQDMEHTEGQIVASLLLAVSWIVFLLVGVERFGIRSYIASIGIAAPLAILAMLLVANIIFGVTLIDIWPSWDAFRDDLPLLAAIPFPG